MIRGTWKDENGDWWTQEGVLAFDQDGNCKHIELPPRSAKPGEIEFAIFLTTPDPVVTEQTTCLGLISGHGCSCGQHGL